MKKDEYRRWFADQLAQQNRLLTGAIAALVSLGLIAALIEATLFAIILRFSILSSSWPTAYFVSFCIQGAMLFVTFLRLSKQLPDTEHEVELEEGSTVIRTAPTMSTVWTYALGSLETDQTWIERLFSILALPQRLFCAAWYTWQRIIRLKTIDVNDCSTVVRLLDRKRERIEVSDLAEELQLPDIATTLSNVSLIDGVMFLKQKSMGLSLTNRLVDAMEEWSRKNSKSPE
ncbi:MAG: hypothetical protein KDB01_24280 [Planctomycetaceae bacterium]|nr:hypothetical protein [Planctomycetaceae bacterium]